MMIEGISDTLTIRSESSKTPLRSVPRWIDTPLRFCLLLFLLLNCWHILLSLLYGGGKKKATPS